MSQHQAWTSDIAAVLSTPTRFRKDRQRAPQLKMYICTDCRAGKCEGCLDQVRIRAFLTAGLQIKEALCHCKKAHHVVHA